MATDNLAKAREAKAAKAAATRATEAKIDAAAEKAVEAAADRVIERQIERAAAVDVLLSPEDLAAIREEATKIFFEERRAQARKMAIKGELAALRRQHGDSVMFGDHMDDIVTLMIDLPDFSEAIIVDQQRIEHGKQWTGPRHKAVSLMETMYRGREHDHNLSGKTRAEYYRRQSPIEVTAKGAQVVQTEAVRIG